MGNEGYEQLDRYAGQDVGEEHDARRQIVAVVAVVGLGAEATHALLVLHEVVSGAEHDDEGKAVAEAEQAEAHEDERRVVLLPYLVDHFVGRVHAVFVVVVRLVAVVVVGTRC